jgi:hypothetical protein
MSGDYLNAIGGALARRQQPSSTASHPAQSTTIEVGNEERIELLDRLLNDPDVPLEPARIWSLLAEIRDAR